VASRERELQRRVFRAEVTNLDLAGANSERSPLTAAEGSVPGAMGHLPVTRDSTPRAHPPHQRPSSYPRYRRRRGAGGQEGARGV